MTGAKAPKPGGLARQSLSQAIVEEVLEWLGKGRYKPDDLLPNEREMMAYFNVGRNTVREAMQAMVTMRVIEVRPGRGTRVLRTEPAAVLPPDVMSALMLPNTLEELYEFRLVIEPGVAGFAAQRATSKDIASMNAALDKYETAMEAGEPVAPHDVLFHRRVAVAAHNSIYLKITDAVAELLINARRATDLVQSAVRSAALDHRAILDAIATRDSDAASQLMAEHVQSAIRALAEARDLTQVPASSATATEKLEEPDE
jgi:DNA-binding FadR family transcriptional regulator